MGNKACSEQAYAHVLKMYQELISRDFDDEISMIAAKKYPKNLEKAVNFILKRNDKCDKNDEKQEKSKLDVNKFLLLCNGDDILECPSLMRLRETLTFYNKYLQKNTQTIETYFNQNKNLIINDYHHLLSKHLNEDNLSKMNQIDNFKKFIIY